MDYLLSRESYAKDTRNLSLKLGRSYKYDELTYLFTPRFRSKGRTKFKVNYRHTLRRDIAQPSC